MLIQAFQRIKGDRYRLIIAGDVFPPPSYAEFLQELAKPDSRISFYLRYIPDDEVQVFMNASDIVVLPFARILTSGTTVLAMSFGRPVIVPRLGCLPELVEPDAGWVYPPGDTEALAAIMQIAAASDFKQIGARAYEKLLCLTWQHFAEQTIEAYWGPFA